MPRRKLVISCFVYIYCTLLCSSLNSLHYRFCLSDYSSICFFQAP